MGAWEQCMFHLQRPFSIVLVSNSVQYKHLYTESNHLIQMGALDLSLEVEERRVVGPQDTK